MKSLLSFIMLPSIHGRGRGWVFFLLLFSILNVQFSMFNEVKAQKGSLYLHVAQSGSITTYNLADINNVHFGGNTMDIVTATTTNSYAYSPLNTAVVSSDPDPQLDYTNGFGTDGSYEAPSQDASGYYLIDNGGKLFWLAEQVNNGTGVAYNAKLTADIDLENRPWTPMGNATYKHSGEFDGQGHSITGLNVNTDAAYAAFIGVHNGTNDVKKFRISGSVTTTGTTNSHYAAGVVASSTGSHKIQDIWCSVDVNLPNTTSTIGSRAAGIVLHAESSTISRCVYDGTVNGYNTNMQAAGIVGWPNNGSVKVNDCLFRGKLTSTGKEARAGGIIGHVGKAGIKSSNCLSIGTYEYPSNGIYTGALCGSANTNLVSTTYTNCYVLEGQPLVGSAWTNTEYPTATAVNDAQLANGTITTALGDNWIQGAATPVPHDPNELPATHTHSYTNGFCTDATCTSPYEEATQDSEGYYLIDNGGKLFWLAQQVNNGTGTNYDAKLTADINLENRPWTPMGDDTNYHAGEFDGQGFSITGLKIQADDAMTRAAFIGYHNSTKDVHNFKISGSITATGTTSNHYAAGVISRVNGACKIQDIWSSVNISSINTAVTSIRLAGIVTKAQATTIDRCVYDGTINGSTTSLQVAGILGWNDADNTTVTNCLYAGTLTSTGTGSSSAYLGGILGYAGNYGGLNCSNNLSIGTIDSPSAATRSGALVGNNSRSLDFFVNNYILQGLPITGSGSSKIPTVTEVTTAQLTDGTLPDLLSSTNWVQGTNYPIPQENTVITEADMTVGGIKYVITSDNTVAVTYPNAEQPASGNASTYTGEITIPASITIKGKTFNVTAIGDYAFWGAGITSLTLSEGIVSLGNKSIYNTQITKITVPNSVTTTDYEALGYNTLLDTIRFGGNIAANKWGDKLCYNPSGTGKKKEVYMYCNAVPQLRTYTFDFAKATVHVYPDLYDAYMADAAWATYDIVGDLGLENISEFTVNGIKYKILSGSNVYVTYPNESQPSSGNVSTYSGDIVIPAQVSYGGGTFNVTAIGDYAFWGAGITSLTLSEGITKLGYKSIYNTQITEITLPNSVTTMDYEALGYNTLLVTINFGENIAANKWGDKLCYNPSGTGKKKEVYMNCNAVPQLQSYTFDFAKANVHVRPTMYSAFKADAVWSTYDIIGDLWIEYTYDDLQAAITNYAAPTGNAVGTDPGCYTVASVQALNDALTAAQALDNTATLEQLNTAINNLIIAYDGLKTIELQEGYYALENIYKPYALYGDASTADTQGLKLETPFDASKQKFYFKLTRKGGNWLMQCVDNGMYVGTIIGASSATSSSKYISLTTNPENEQIITWVAGGAFKIRGIYNGSTTLPYAYYNYGAMTRDCTDAETRIQWHFHPAVPGTYPLDFNLENGRVRGFVHDFEYTASDASKISTYNVAPPARRDQPVPATVFWTRDASSTAQHVTWSTDATFTDATTVEVDNSNASYEIYNLYPGKTYYYKVTATVGGSETELINSTFTTSGQVRMIKADGVSNIRDLGGWTTASGKTIAYGKIFRGAAFTSTTITQEGIDAVRATGVKAELDLRDGSQDGSMSASLLGSDVEYNRIKLAQTASHMTGLTNSKSQYIQCVQYVLDCVKNNKPVYFHCAIGRDRTGTLAFLLEGVLGMSKSDMYKEYELTNFSSLNTPCSKGQLDEMFTMIEGLSGATLEDKFYTYLTTEFGIAAADLDEFRTIMLGLPPVLTPPEVQDVISTAATSRA